MPLFPFLCHNQKNIQATRYCVYWLHFGLGSFLPGSDGAGCEEESSYTPTLPPTFFHPD